MCLNFCIVGFFLVAVKRNMRLTTYFLMFLGRLLLPSPGATAIGAYLNIYRPTLTAATRASD
jgi:hypothetical protein